MERGDRAVEGVDGMKVVILAGGMGTRISEESRFKPKPMVEIGDRPILWHIMKWYASFGFQEFVICCGYKGHVIKDYFLNYSAYQGDGIYDLNTDGDGTYGCRDAGKDRERWKVTLANTGRLTKTAGRLLRVREYLEGEPFMLTYGDGVADVDLDRLLACHKAGGRLATITTTQPEGRFGTVRMEPDGRVDSFREKARRDQSWVNIGFMVMEPGVFDYLGDGSQMLEDEPFERLAAAGEMDAYRHEGFWAPMDTLRDKECLEELWAQGQAPWKR